MSSYIVLITTDVADAVDRYIQLAEDNGTDNLVAIEDGRVIREVARGEEASPK